MSVHLFTVLLFVFVTNKRVCTFDSSMSECEPSDSSVEDGCEDTSSDSQLDSSIDSVHTSSPSHISHADIEV